MKTKFIMLMFFTTVSLSSYAHHRGGYGGYYNRYPMHSYARVCVGATPNVGYYNNGNYGGYYPTTVYAGYNNGCGVNGGYVRVAPNVSYYGNGYHRGNYGGCYGGYYRGGYNGYHGGGFHGGGRR